MKHSKFFTCLIINSLLITQFSRAQEPIKAIWHLSKNQEAITEGNITAANQKLDNLSIAAYISTASQRIIPQDLHWPKENSLNAERYAEYAITAAKGDLKISNIAMSLSFNSSSAGRATVSYSIDGKNFKHLQENMELISGSIPKEYHFENLAINLPKYKTLYLRIYPFTSNEIASRYLVTKEVSITGTL